MSNTVLAIDFGTKRVGVAVSRASLAEPLEVVVNSTGATHDSAVLERIKQLCIQEEITRVLVGQSEQAMALKSAEFAQALREYLTSGENQVEFSVPVELVDETLSSYQVAQKLKQAGKRVPTIDHYAAAEFLQEWLDEHPDVTRPEPL